jgi:parallel beta-helix repeat protein
MIYNVKDFGATGDGCTNDRPALQAALDAARENGGGVVEVPAGRYLIDDCLEIFSRTTLRLAPEAVIVRGGTFGNMIRPGLLGVNGYEGVHDVALEGGTWDFNGQTHQSSGTAITFAHARRLVIRDLAVVNVYRNHCIEINSTHTALVENCVFDGQLGEPRQSEAIQIDGAFRESVYPAGGNYDYTTCDNIEIRGCYFTRWSRGIGSHTYESGYTHKNIRIIGNHFEGMYDDGVRAYGYDGLVVVGNTFAGCHNGVTVEYSTGGTIQGNTIVDSKNNGINLYNQVEGFAVQGNVVANSADQGISLYNAAHANVITGNNVYHNGNYGIALNACNNNAVVGNLLRNNGKDGSEPGVGILNGSYNNLVADNRIWGYGSDVKDTSGSTNQLSGNY